MTKSPINNSVANMVSKASLPSKFLELTRTNLKITKVAEMLPVLYKEPKKLLKNSFKIDSVENLLPVPVVEEEVEVRIIYFFRQITMFFSNSALNVARTES